MLLNDGTDQDHFGCQLVVRALVKAFRPVKTVKVFHPPTEDDLEGIEFIVVNAEGSTHHNQAPWLYQNYGIPSVFINAVWERNGPADLSHFLYVSARESLSAKLLEDCAPKVHVVPDVMLSHRIDGGYGNGMVISDSVARRACKGMGTTPAMANLETFLGADQLVCGRFHAACLAIVTDKPFTCYPSNTHKTKGMMLDAGLDNYYEMQQQAMDCCPPMPDPQAQVFLGDARRRIDAMVATVRGLIDAAV